MLDRLIMDSGHPFHSTPFDSSRYAKRINDVLHLLSGVRRSLIQTDIIPGKVYNKSYKPSLSPPKVLILGNKGAGKTSLIYTLAQLPIRRVPPTCCPVEIQLRRPKEGEKSTYQYSVSVELRRSTDQSTNQTIEKESTNELDEIERIVTAAHIWVKDAKGHVRNSNYVIVIEINRATLDVILVDLPPLDHIVRNDLCYYF